MVTPDHKRALEGNDITDPDHRRALEERDITDPRPLRIDYEHVAYYEINVSRHGRHLFATNQRSVPSKMKMEELAALFEAKFHKDDGYVVGITAQIQYGRKIK